MARKLLWLVCLLLFPSPWLLAVENVNTGTYNENIPSGSDITHWGTGWTQPSTQPTGYTYTTGWNYVGNVSGSSGGYASGVYLGNGWVITCAHIGAGNFSLNGTTYNYVANSTHTFTGTATQKVVTGSGTTTISFVNPVDFVVFQVSPYPSLPSLRLRQSNPTLNNCSVVMIGYGDGGGHGNETWGYNSVNYAVSIFVNIVQNSISYWTNDIATQSNTSNAPYQLVDGDSGGGDFIYNSSTGFWELAGLNEGIFSGGGSVFVQINNSTFDTVYDGYPETGDTTTFTGSTTYENQINSILDALAAVDTPAMPCWALVLMGGVLLAAAVPAVLAERR